MEPKIGSLKTDRLNGALGIPEYLLALLIGSFEYVKRFGNLKFTIKRTKNIQSSGLSSSEDTAVTCCAFKVSLINSRLPYYY